MASNLSLVKKIFIRNKKFSKGELGFLECEDDIPFNIKRVFYNLGTKKNQIRGNHAHHYCYELLITLKGSLRVICSDGSSKKVYQLNHPYEGLLINKS